MQPKHFHAITIQAPATMWWLAVNKQYDVYVSHLKIELFNYQVSQR